jgi:23S rRNA pseudouridine1911/1915/1917 synthase
MMGNDLIFIVKMGEENKKLREYLRANAKLSGRLIKNTAMNHKIEVNDRITKLNYMVKVSDVITFKIDKEETQNIEPEKMDIDVVYEDSDMIVVNKSFGIVVHPTKSYQHNTLANGLLYYFKEKGENCIVRLVNRLDMDTSGLIIIAKNQFAHMALARDMGQDKLKKKLSCFSSR